MALPITSVKDSGLPLLSPAAFEAELRTGDLIFASDPRLIGRIIEGVTHSPFSHVLMAWRPISTGPWLALQSTFPAGVNVAPLEHYLEGSDGDLVLCRVPKWTPADIDAALARGLGLLGRPYNVSEEFQILLHKALPFLPVNPSFHDLYCSALIQDMSMATNFPFPMGRTGGNPSPNGIYLDENVLAICGMLA